MTTPEQIPATHYLHQSVTVTIDRPLGSRHPDWDFEYPVNYGYLPGTISGDGEAVDAYVLGVERAITHFTGYCVAVIHRVDDEDDKLVVVPPDWRAISDDVILAMTAFQERYFQSRIIRRAE